MDPKAVAQQLRKPEGEEGINIGNTMNTGNLAMNQMVFSCVNVQPGDKVLEIGFGNGKLIPVLLNDTPNVFYAGIDYSADMVKEAEVFNQSLIKSKTVEIQQGEFEKIPYPDNSFNKVCTINTLYFLNEPLKGLKEIFRVLQPGGKIFMGIRPRWAVSQVSFSQYGFTLYSEEEAEELLSKAGFKNTGHQKLDEGEKEFMGSKFKWASACIIGEK